VALAPRRRAGCALTGLADRLNRARVGVGAPGPVHHCRQHTLIGLSPDYSRDFVAKARFPKRIADAPGAAQRGALAVRRSEQRGRKTRGARKASLQQKES
jgi:hypothetical protein